MSLSLQVAKHFREIHFGGNWATSNLKDNLSDVSWQEATTKVHSFNTIATLTFHTSYYVSALLRVLQGKALDAKDQLSFDHPSIQSQEDWNNLLGKIWSEAEQAAALIEELPEDKFREDFTDKKYGNYYRNIHGIIEHTHYHLGQIALLKKLLREENKVSR
jgi:hypothetical protein